MDQHTPNSIDVTSINRWSERWQEAALRLAIFIAPAVAIALLPITLIFNHASGTGFVSHVLGSIFISILSGAASGGGVWWWIWATSGQRGRQVKRLTETGTVVRAHIRGGVRIVGTSFGPPILGAIINRIVEPMAPMLGDYVPIFRASFETNIQGTPHQWRECIFSDEARRLSEGVCIAVLIDPQSPTTLHWMVRPIDVKAASDDDLLDEAA